MKVTNVSIRKMDKAAMKAIATITFDETFVVHDIKVIEGNKGLFIAMPSRKLKDNTFVDVAHPIDKDTRAEIQAAVLDAYDKAS